MQPHLPEDILIRIIFFLSPPDIVRLRQASKTLCSLTHDFLVWIRAYQNAAIPRPPGPYARSGDKEALEFLERTLVQSAKAEPWSTRSFSPSVRHTFTRVSNEYHWHISWGRWFITTIGPSVVYHSLHSDNPEIHTLFKLDKHDASFRDVLCADTVTLLGHPVTYALITVDGVDFPLTKILLKMACHHSSLSLESTTPLSFSRSTFNIIYTITAAPRYICMTGHDDSFALFDVTTEKMYYLPPFSSSMPATEVDRVMRMGRDWFSLRCLLTNTHVLAIFDGLGGGHDDCIVQAFLLPSEHNITTANDVLQITHEGICNMDESPSWTLRDNVVTGVAGKTTTVLRFIGYRCNESETTFKVIDFTLSPSPSLGPGSLKLTSIDPLFSFVGIPFFTQIASSQDGFGRGVCFFGNDGGPCMRTFSVDASGPICQVVLGPEASVVKVGRRGCITMEFYAGNGTLCYEYAGQVKVFGFE